MSQSNESRPAAGPTFPGSLAQYPSHLPLSEVAYQRIKSALLDGSLPPGELLVENKLAMSLGMSRTPVREALRKLVSENLVTFLPGRKAIVSRPSLRELREIYAIREIVETAALRNIAARPDDVRDVLGDCIATAERLRQQGDHVGAVRANSAFHRSIVSAMGNHALDNMLITLYENNFRFLAFLSEDATRRLEGHGEHERILQHLVRGEADACVELMVEHLERGRDALLQRFSDID